jgi:nicotinamide-nucleotide adenylyltransferase
MVKRGMFVGRFQPFHKGHLEAVKGILREVDEIVIVVGSSQYSHNLENPFTAGERITMIRRAIQDCGIQPPRYWIVPVPDANGQMVWVAQVVGYSPKFDVVYTNEPLSHRLFVEADFKVKPVPFHKRKVYSATEIRKRMLGEKDWEELVPKSVAHFIKEIGGIERLRDLTKTDAIT